MRWLMFFTVEMDLEPEVYEGFGDVAEERAGVELTRLVEKATGNRTWYHVASIPKNDVWSKKNRVEVPFQWAEQIERGEMSETSPKTDNGGRDDSA